jgi:hypothetical protein
VAFNGIEAPLDFHGREVLQLAADGARQLGHPDLRAMILAALAPDPDWPRLEDRWDRGAEIRIEAFIEAHATSCFVEEPLRS